MKALHFLKWTQKNPHYQDEMITENKTALRKMKSCGHA